MQRVSINGFIQTILEKILKLCDNQYKIASISYLVKVTIKLRVIYDKATFKVFYNSPTPVAKPSTLLGIEKGRSSKVEEAILVRLETRTLAGDFEAQITRYQRYDNENCTN